MSEPTEIEKKISGPSNLEIELLAALQQRPEPFSSAFGGVQPGELHIAERAAILTLLREATERRLRAEYFGQSSITGRDSSQERID